MIYLIEPWPVFRMSLSLDPLSFRHKMSTFSIGQEIIFCFSCSTVLLHVLNSRVKYCLSSFSFLHSSLRICSFSSTPGWRRLFIQNFLLSPPKHVLAIRAIFFPVLTGNLSPNDESLHLPYIVLSLPQLNLGLAPVKTLLPYSRPKIPQHSKAESLFPNRLCRAGFFVTWKISSISCVTLRSQDSFRLRDLMTAHAQSSPHPGLVCLKTVPSYLSVPPNTYFHSDFAGDIPPSTRANLITFFFSVRLMARFMMDLFAVLTSRGRSADSFVTLLSRVHKTFFYSFPPSPAEYSGFSCLRSFLPPPTTPCDCMTRRPFAHPHLVILEISLLFFPPSESSPFK